MPRPRQTTVSRTGELDLLRRIRARAARRSVRDVALGIGDDCALLRVRPGEAVAVTTDLSIAGRHFRLDWHPAASVGHRTLARGLSDLAAMGARPLAAFLSLGLPRELTLPPRRNAKSWSERFYDGLLALASTYNVPLAGGDLSESPVALADIVLIGAVPDGKALLRSGARPGDILYVTGALGGAAAGLDRLNALAAQQKPIPTRPVRIPRGDAAQLATHLYPEPRLAVGSWLRRRGAASAAIDLSDGISTDLHHICEESGVRAELNADSLPIAPGATVEQALHGGEDYELLFAARPSTRLPRKIAGIPITAVGRIVRRRTSEPPVLLHTSTGAHPLAPQGWQHFSGR